MALCVALSTACFHQVVQTGRPPGNTIVDKPWVATWVFGLVAAPEIDVRRECPTGAAVITTEQSFMNGLVAVVTLGIYTPQHVTITCATSSASLPARSIEVRIPTDASAAQSAEIVSRAVEKAAETGSPVVLHF
jgi:hypothetical protein